MASYDDDGQSSSDDEGNYLKGDAAPPGLSEAEAVRREERLKKNRQKARDRRNRKKVMIEEMQRNVVVLSRLNSELRRKNQELMQKLSRFGAAGVPSSASLGQELQGTMLGTSLPGQVSPLSGAGQSAIIGGGQVALSGAGHATQLRLPSATDALVVAPGRQDYAAAAGSATTGPTDVGSILSRYRGLSTGVSSTGGPARNALSVGAGPSAIDPSVIRAFLSQQQSLQGQQAQFTGLPPVAAAATAFGTSNSNTTQSPSTSVALSASQPSAPGSIDRPVHIVVHHHHQRPGQQQGNAAGVIGAPGASLGIVSAAPSSVQAALARQLSLPHGTTAMSVIGNLGSSRSADPSPRPPGAPL